MPTAKQQRLGKALDGYQFGFKEPERAVFKAPRGLNERVVRSISEHKNEPGWMTGFRLRAFEIFGQKPLPTWGADLTGIDFDNLYYYLKPVVRQGKTWNDVPAEMKRTFERLGIPEAERRYLAGVGAQYDSEVIYHNLQEKLRAKGVIFTDMDSALKDYPELVKPYFSKLIPPFDNKFAALNSAVWSGGSFVYVPRGVEVEMPLQAYFRINAKNMGQFERTLIIAEEGSSVHYVEGCVPAGTQISTGDRWTNIEAIKPGDSVVTADGKKHKVTKTMVRNYHGNMVRIVPKVSGFNTLELTPEHPVYGIRRQAVGVRRKTRGNWLPEVSTALLTDATPEYIPAGQLQTGDFLVFPVVEGSAARPFDYATLRLLGYYAAEGSTFTNSANNTKGVQFTFNQDELFRISETKMLCQFVGGKVANVSGQPERHASAVSCTSVLLKELCEQHVGKLAHAKCFSSELMGLPPQDIAILIDAYLGGDGSSWKRQSGHMTVRAITASKEMAVQLQELLGRCGIFATLTVRAGGKDTVLGRTIKRLDQYVLHFTDGKNMGEVRKTKHGFIVPIGKITRRLHDGPVFNLEVAESNSYLVCGAAVHNCTAPIYASDSLHAAVVEIFVKPGARVRYTTIQNWSKDVYNLVTKRARVEEEGVMEWIDGNIGSRVSMKYPSVYLMGRKAHGEVLSLAFAAQGQHQDVGAKAIHAAPETTSVITSKSISKNGGRTSYRGLLHIAPVARGARSTVRCDALILDPLSRSDTYPTMKIRAKEVTVGHEATVSKIGDEQLFYLRSRGLKESEASAMIVNGFIEPIVKTLPLEYAIELNRLVELEMEGSVG